ncbi:MAG: 3-hydroxybutyryl-CoA dehydratase [Deltaproteobacteria bacterium]|nr:3-hydroxybutyryl-CoA dehydratase [Deltaproteobacteria bacterium]MBI2348812.1 3-hydroxybutyryl-CoA dehydratase [Deltaproteobacteria bacterium]MBI2540697.1 3-hydroxybutyryl-CoA dehydratase [Deltaproteobacteria bacterium]MBI2991169.1 3-hydroxybutyryl-CoA dehydratase [Deltaproteobacteria bacterium]MBI3061841.1 3-hydroxybutyryl-CoA dehydratase [Deltaproteobacteria bacterium]
MKELVAVDLEKVVQATSSEGKGRRILWQDSESIAFLSRGRKRRMDFHIDPSDEVTLQLRGVQRLHYKTPEGEEKVAVIHPGQILLCPGGVPHSPRVSEDAWFIVFERKRKAGEEDRFLWFCERCGEKVYEVAVPVGDYSQDPVSQVHQKFYGDEALRTCKRCSAVVPRPEG